VIYLGNGICNNFLQKYKTLPFNAIIFSYLDSFLIKKVLRRQFWAKQKKIVNFINSDKTMEF